MHLIRKQVKQIAVTDPTCKAVIDASFTKGLASIYFFQPLIYARIGKQLFQIHRTEMFDTI